MGLVARKSWRFGKHTGLRGTVDLLYTDEGHIEGGCVFKSGHL